MTKEVTIRIAYDSSAYLAESLREIAENVVDHALAGSGAYQGQNYGFIVRDKPEVAPAQILIEEEEARLVELSKSISHGHYTRLDANFYMRGNVALIRMHEGGKTKTFRLSKAELEALLVAHTEYQAHLLAKKEQEERENALLFEKVKARVMVPPSAMTRKYEKKPDNGYDCDLYEVIFEGRWSHCNMYQVSIWRIEDRVAGLELTIEQEEYAKEHAPDPDAF